MNDITPIISADERISSADTIADLLANRDFVALRELTENIPAVDLASAFLDVPERHRVLLFRLLSKEQATKTFVELSSDLQRVLIDGFSDAELSDMLDELYLDDTVDIIEEMPANLVKRIVRGSTPENREIINKLLRFDKDTAGALMTTEYVRLTPEITVSEALARIKRVAIDKETIYTCYVTDHQRRLRGIVTAKSLLLSDSDVTMEDIMEENVVFARTDDPRESVARLFDKYGFLALPVVDSETRLVGIITVDDAMDVLREETEEDFAKMAGITPSNETTYLRTPFLSLFKARIPWLLLLMVSATLSSTILGKFEAALPSVLLLFIPMLMDTGGNSGGQASVTVIRGISLGEIFPRDILRVLWKELRVGLISGLTLGAVAFLKVMVVDNLLMNNPAVTLTVAFSVALTLALTIISSKLIGAVLPIVATKLGFDPAVMASPFITTIVDAISLLVYFAIASVLII